MVARTVYAAVPPHVECAVTPFGRTLAPLLEAMERWGAECLAHAAAADEGT